MRAVMAMILALGACNMPADAEQGSGGKGTSESRTFDVRAFHNIALGGPFDVVVTVGSEASVVAEGDPELLDRLDVRVQNGELRIKTKKDGWSWRQAGGRTVSIRVTAPSLSGAAIGGSGDMRIDKVEGETFSASIGGSGNMEIGSLRTRRAEFSIAGSGNITASGKVDDADISIGGSGNAALAALESRIASISVVGSGDVRARAMESADVSIIGSGDVALSGSAKCKVTNLGSGEVRCQV